MQHLVGSQYYRTSVLTIYTKQKALIIILFENLYKGKITCNIESDSV